MSLPDMAEYWWDVKRTSNKKIFVHVKGLDCGHYHVKESDELQFINCYACKELISQDEELREKLESNNGKSHEKWIRRQKKKSGYKLSSVIKFGKYKGHQKTIEWIIKNDSSYFKWLKDKILLHSEVDQYLLSNVL